MARTKDVIVAQNSTVYRMSKNKWLNYLSDKAKGQANNLGSYGAKEVVQINRNLTDFTDQQAQAELETLQPPVVVVQATGTDNVTF